MESGFTLHQQVATQDVLRQTLVETQLYLKSLKADAETLKFMQAVFLLAGDKKPKSLKDAVGQLNSRAQLQADLAEVGLAEDFGPDPDEEQQQKKKGAGKSSKKQAQRWKNAEACTSSVDLANLSRRSPVPIQILITWYKSVRTVHK